jgi:glycosyltransferase involved in cell wall biosynthesis
VAHELDAAGRRRRPLILRVSPFAFTCLLPVWAGDAPAAFLQAARSVEESTLPPDEILICQDGPLSRELARVVTDLLCDPRYRLTSNEGPRGLHHNLNRAALTVRTPWIARMDADDLNRPDRFAAQVAFLSAHPQVDVLGGSIVEVADDGSRRRRATPVTHDEIVRRGRWRSPMNHMTVFMRRRAFLAAGGYPDIPRKEDYALWLRMIAKGAVFANLPQDLVEVRLGPDFARRRAGLASARSEYRLYALRRRLLAAGGPLDAAVFLARAAALSSSVPAALLYRTVLR